MPAIEEICTIAASTVTDHAVAPFLALIARDMVARPQALVPLTMSLATRIIESTDGVESDLNLPIEGIVAL